MTKITKTANTLDEGVQIMIEGAKEDYKRWLAEQATYAEKL